MYIYDNSIEDKEATLLFRSMKGRLTKQYVEILPEWAVPIYDCNL